MIKPTAGKLHSYRLFGLNIRSAMPLPELAAVEEFGEVSIDVDIRLADIPPLAAPLEYLEMQIEVRGHAEMVIDAPESGRFLIREGREILVCPDPAATDAETRIYLLGTALGAIMHQRGLLPIHANAVEVNGNAYAFAGESGAGKSTLAAYFQSRGYRLLSDDVCLISFDEAGQPWVWPGIPRVKLWQDALTELGRNSEGLTPIGWGLNKYHLPIEAYAAGGPYPLRGLYALYEVSGENSPGIIRMSGIDATNIITANTYRRRLVDFCGQAGRYLTQTVSLQKAVPVYSVNRDWGFQSFWTEAEALESHMTAPSVER